MFDVKTVTSRRATDCGAACMTSFLDYYGETVTLDDMIKECNVDISGSSAGDLKRCGVSHGLDIKIWKDVDDGEGDPYVDDRDVYMFDRPSICWWKRNHWIVCCGKDDSEKVVIMNPSRGRYGISESMFKMLFSGIAITNGVPPKLEE